MNKRVLTGYTLVELMITLVIFSVIIVVIYTTFSLSQRTWTDYAANTAPKQNLRNGMIAMVNELRETTQPFITRTKTGVGLTVVHPQLGPISYRWTSEGPDARKVMRTNYANTRMLTHDIDAVDFTTASDNEIVISLEAGTLQKFGLKEKVALRSKTGLIAQSAHEKIQ